MINEPMGEPMGGNLAKIGEITLTQMLKDKRTQLEQQLEDIKRIQQILDENPKLAELHNLLVRIH